MIPLGELVIITLTELITGSSQNAAVFRELGGASLATQLVSHLDTREAGLGLLQQLIVVAGPGAEEDMTGLLELLHWGHSRDLAVKISVMRCLIACLKESHRCRSLFRRIGGFVYVMSVLVGLEGSLDDCADNSWKNVDRKELLVLLKEIFISFAVAMRYEPANAKYFHQEIAKNGLVEAVRLLGCFSADKTIRTIVVEPEKELLESFQFIFSSQVPDIMKGQRYVFF